MRALIACALLCSACFPFADALGRCEQAGRCPAAAGGGGGGGGAGGSGFGDGGVAVGSAHCSPDGICWEHPLPTGNTLYAVWVNSPDEWWVAGARGTVLHFKDGVLALDAPSSAATDLDVYRSLWGLPNGDVLLAGTGPHVLHQHTASGWVPVPVAGSTGMAIGSPTLTAEVDSGTVWLAGTGGVGHSLTSGGFTFSPADFPGDPLGAGGATATGLFVTVSSGSAPHLYYVDAGMDPASVPITVPGANELATVTQDPTGALWVGGLDTVGASFASRFSGGGWASFSFGGVDRGQVSGMYAPNGDAMLLACRHGSIARATPGTQQVAIERNPTELDYDLYAIHGSGDFAVAAGSGELFVRRGPGQWSTVLEPDARFFMRAAAADGVVAAVGSGGLIAVRDAGLWDTVAPPPQDTNLHGIGVLHGRLLVSADSDVYLSSASSWTPLHCPTVQPTASYTDIAAAGDDAWALSTKGDIVHFRPDAGCVHELSYPQPLTAIAASSALGAWAVADHGVVLARDLPDGGWRGVTPPADAQLVDVAVSSTNAYALDTTGQIYLLSGMGGTFGGDSQCFHALAVSERGGGDVVLTAGQMDMGDPRLCVWSPGMGETVLRVPSDQDVIAMRAYGQRVWMFGAGFSVLSWPIP